MRTEIVLEPERKVFCDSLTITVQQDKVRFHAQIDGSGNVFLINRQLLKEMLYTLSEVKNGGKK